MTRPQLEFEFGILALTLLCSVPTHRARAKGLAKKWTATIWRRLNDARKSDVVWERLRQECNGSTRALEVEAMGLEETIRYFEARLSSSMWSGLTCVSPPLGTSNYEIACRMMEERIRVRPTLWQRFCSWLAGWRGRHLPGYGSTDRLRRPREVRLDLTTDSRQSEEMRGFARASPCHETALTQDQRTHVEAVAVRLLGDEKSALDKGGVDEPFADDECPICYIRKIDCRTTCGHLFCWRCLRRWLEAAPLAATCPFDHQELRPGDVVFLSDRSTRGVTWSDGGQSGEMRLL